MHNTTVLFNEPASLLNFLTDAAHTLVSRLGKILRITFLPLNFSSVTVDKSLAVNLKSGALLPVAGRLPLVCTGFPLNLIDAMFLIYLKS
jgi:hypothetical protein